MITVADVRRIAEECGKCHLAGVDNFSCLCPAHPNKDTPALSIGLRDGQVVWKCHAGCSQQEVTDALTAAGLWPIEERHHQAARKQKGDMLESASCTLAELAAAKGFTEKFLSDHDVEQQRNVVVFHYRLLNGQKASRHRVRLSMAGEKKFTWNKQKGDPPAYGVWRLPAARKAGIADLVLCEGESDALTFWQHGICALGIPGSTMVARTLEADYLVGFKTVIIVKEDDHPAPREDGKPVTPGGEVFVAGCRAKLAEFGFEGQILIVSMADAAVKDPNALHLKMMGDPGGFESEWGALVLEAQPVASVKAGIQFQSFDYIVEKPIEWLWKNRIALGVLTTFVGTPGIGKTFLTDFIAAAISTAGPWPDGGNAPLGRVILFSGEDMADKTTLPRLRLMRADLSRVINAGEVVEVDAKTGQSVRRDFVIPVVRDRRDHRVISDDMADLEKRIRKFGDVVCVIIDPLSAFQGAVNGNDNPTMRAEVMGRLRRLAEEHNIAVVVVTHYNKGGANSSGDVSQRMSGSIAIPAASRAIFGVSMDWRPEHEHERLLLFGKSNIGPEMPALSFTIVPTCDNPDLATLEWIHRDGDDDTAGLRLGDALKQQDATELTKVEKACAILREMTAGGPCDANEALDRCKVEGISQASLKRARQLLGYKAKRKGYGADSKFSIERGEK